ncbi:MAG: hypothetical protein MSK63_09320 [Clostridiales bacterium]|nr:hypothetical protein [Clostridiales bacterium]MCI7713465.1 hypothetical protein [Clostridiales bacterium]
MENEKKDPRRDPSQLNAIEKLYEKFRGVPLKYIDIFIGLCAAAFFAVVILGMLKERGLL